MRPDRYALVLLVALVSTGCATAQELRRVAVGAPVEGVLTEADVTLDDGSFYQEVVIESDGTPFEVRLLSETFDTYLWLRSPSGAVLQNDDYDDSTDQSRIVVGPSAAEAGDWTAGVNTYSAGEVGAYRIVQRRLDPAEAAALEAEQLEAEREQALTRAASLDAQASVLADEGQIAEARARALEALELRAQAEGPDGPLVAQSLVGLGVLAEKDGDYAAAEGYFARARAILEGGALDAGGVTLGTVLSRLALAQHYQDKLDEAAPTYERAVELQGDAVSAPLLYNFALLRQDQGDARGAVALFERVLAIEEAELGADDPEVAVTLNALGVAQQAAGELSAARGSFERALAIEERQTLAPPPPPPAIPDSTAAGGLQREAVTVLPFDPGEAPGESEGEPLDEAPPADPARLAVAASLRNVAAVALQQDDPAAALDALERALAIYEAQLGADDPRTAQTRSALGEAVQLAAFAAARPLYAEALAALDAALGAADSLTVRTRNNLARLDRAAEALRTQATPAVTRGGLADIDVDDGPPRPSREGLDRALLFATDTYDDPSFAALSNPITDAEAIAAELERRYGFAVEIVRNPTRAEVYAALGEAAAAATAAADGPGGQVLVFFAGHGTYLGDDDRGRGFVIPRDGRADDRSTWFSYAALAEELDAMPDHRVLLVLDVCYGGSFVKRHRGDGNPYRDASAAELMAKYGPYEARLVLTSGAREYVSDGRPGQHSPFAHHLLRALRSGGGPDGDGLLLFEELIGYARDVAGPTPLAGGFGRNDAGSTFFFYDPSADG